MNRRLNQSLEIQEMELGLERISRVDQLLGSPSSSFASIHIAGTNGKGSVATKIAANLQANGYRVGLFTSPHISSYCERVRVNGVSISEKVADSLLNQIAESERLTYFELTTMLAFLYFAQQKVDYAVLEVGLGGRLDATNIVTPKLSVITSISIDHTQYLGKTLESIAFEKGGIIKQGVPVLLGPKALPQSVFVEIAQEKQSPLFQLDGMYCDYEAENQEIARRALQILDFSVDEKAIWAVPPCRFERIGNVILDVAHNPDGMTRTFERTQGNVRSLLSFASDKDVEAMLKIAVKYSQVVHLTQNHHARAFHVANFKPKYPCMIDSNFDRAFETAYQLATEQGQTLLVCGSHFMMESVRAKLGMELARPFPIHT